MLVSKCPHCGSAEFVTRYRVTGVISVREDPTGSSQGCENTGMWDGVRLKKTKAKTRCGDCNEVIPESLDVPNPA